MPVRSAARQPSRSQTRPATDSQRPSGPASSGSGRAGKKLRVRPKPESGSAETDTLAPLVVLAQGGDSLSRNELFSRLRPAVRQWARVEVGEGRAEDLCQEVLFRAHRKLNSLEAPGAIRKWLRVMTRRLGYNLLKRERPERRWWASATNDRSLDIFDLIPGRENDPAQEILDEADRRACLELIWQVVEGLDSRQRILAKLYYGEGRPISAIARALGTVGRPLPQGTVKTLLNRLRINLRAGVREIGEPQTSAPRPLEA